jgi:hypothetical protein
MCRILTAVLLLTTSLAFAQTKNLSTDPEKFEFGFNSGGKLRMELGAGDADIIGGKEDKIIITYTTSKPEQAKNVRVEADLRDTWGTLKVHGPHSNFRYTIQVPAKTNLYVRMSGGRSRDHWDRRPQGRRVPCRRPEDQPRRPAEVWRGGCVREVR